MFGFSFKSCLKKDRAGFISENTGMGLLGKRLGSREHRNQGPGTIRICELGRTMGSWNIGNREHRDG